MAKMMWSAVSLFLLLSAAVSIAEESSEIPVYPNANIDVATSKKLMRTMDIDATCFQTIDSVADVIAFYEKKPGLEIIGGRTSKGAKFSSGLATLSIQNPWMDPTTGRMVKTTLISIVKKQ